MKLLVLSFSLLASLAFAETATVDVSGMHCSGCKHEIRSKVCESADAKANYESCSVEFTNQKQQKGQIKIVTKPEAKIDLAGIQAGVKAAGSEYKITKEKVEGDLVATKKNSDSNVQEATQKVNTKETK